MDNSDFGRGYWTNTKPTNAMR